MSCCTPREKPDSNVPFEQMGCPCDTWAHLKDMFVYLKDQRAGVVPCKPQQFIVQWSFIDVMTYMYSITDKLTGEVIEYSVEKDFTKESPLEAFERDWSERELVYNRGVISGLNDLLEAMEDLNPEIRYKVERPSSKRYIIHKPLEHDLGVIVFKIEYGIRLLDELVTQEGFKDVFTDTTIVFPSELINEITYSTNVLLRRFRKIGVSWLDMENEKVKDFNRFTIDGVSYRNDWSVNTIKISYQDMDLTDPTLRLYHEYYTNKGPQNGYYHCR